MAATARPDNDKVIAQKVGVSPSTIGRWRSGDIDPKPRQVVAFARAYGKSPLGALVSAGYLSEEDLEEELSLGLPADLDEVSTYDLFDEVRHRLEIMGDLVGWVGSIGEHRGSSANLAARALRYAHPATPPADADGEIYIRALEPHLKQTAEYEGNPIFGLREEYHGSIDDLPAYQKERVIAHLAERRAANVGTPTQDDLKAVAREADLEPTDEQ